MEFDDFLPDPTPEVPEEPPPDYPAQPEVKDLDHAPRVPQPRQVEPLQRVPPHSISAEQGVLACVLLDPQNSMDMCSQKISDNAEVFYDLRHRSIFEYCLSLSAKRQGIDIITLSNSMKAGGALDLAGGLAYIAGLPDAVPSAANLEYYLSIVTEKWKARQLLIAATEAITKVYAQEGDGALQLIDELGSWTSRISAESQSTDKTAKQVLNGLLKVLDQESKGIYPNTITTGIEDFDKYYRGYSDGDMVVIAARPSVGKTAFMLQNALHMAASCPVGIFSLEMPQEALYRRMLSNVSGLDLRKIKDFTPQQDRRMCVSGIKLAEMPISVDERPGLNIRQICAKAREWVRSHQVKVIMVDYIGLVKGTMKRSFDDRRIEVAEISSGLKNIAKELNIVVVVLSQLNREVERRGLNSRPRLSDLRESGDLEQDADWIQFLWRGKTDGGESDGEVSEILNQPAVESIVLTTAKNRNGPVGDLALMFNKPSQRFESADRDFTSLKDHP